MSVYQNRIFKNDQWAWLKCVDTIDKKVYEPWEKGGGGDTTIQTFVVLKCQCGNQIQIEESKFPGKRKMPDCGCGGGKRDARKAIKTVMLPVSFITEVESYANVNYKGNFSKALIELARAKLQATRADKLAETETVDTGAALR